VLDGVEEVGEVAGRVGCGNLWHKIRLSDQAARTALLVLVARIGRGYCRIARPEWECPVSQRRHSGAYGGGGEGCGVAFSDHSTRRAPM
jgi:hypothetical protein